MGAATIQLILLYKYFIILPLAVIEGPVISLICGFFVKLNFLSFWPVYLILIAGDLIGDVFWYSVGYFGGEGFVRKFGKYFHITEERENTVKKIFYKYQTSILIISKVTMGFGFALVTLVTAGIVRVSFKKYMMLNFLGQFFWTGGLLAVGYFFGSLYVNFNKGFEIVGFFGFVILGLVILYGALRFINEKFFNKDL